jgi:hypothetical protein
MAALLAIVGLVGFMFRSCAGMLIVNSGSTPKSQLIRFIGSNTECWNF